MDFGDAIRALKRGDRVARSGWNGKGMWLALSRGNDSLEAAKFWAEPNRRYAEGMGGFAPVLPCITMKTAAGEILMGWLASQTDMLAEDWLALDALPTKRAKPEPAAEIMVDRTTLRLVADAVDAYLRMIERREPPPGQNPVDVIDAAVRETYSQRGNAAVPNLRLICSEVLTARLRKEGA